MNNQVTMYNNATEVQKYGTKMLKPKIGFVLILVSFIAAVGVNFEMALFGNSPEPINFVASAAYVAVWIVAYTFLNLSKIKRYQIAGKIYWIVVLLFSLLLLASNTFDINLEGGLIILIPLSFFLTPLLGFHNMKFNLYLTIIIIATAFFVFISFAQHRENVRHKKLL